MGLPCGMDKVDEDVFPKSSTNLEQFLTDPLLLEAAYGSHPYDEDDDEEEVFTTTSCSSPPPLLSPPTTTSSSSFSSASSSCSSACHSGSPSSSNNTDIRLVDEVPLESTSHSLFQQLSVVDDLPRLLRSDGAECMEQVVPHVQELLNVKQPDIQRAASTAFLQILKKELVPIQGYPQTFLRTIVTSIDNSNPDISDAWLGTLLDVIDLLPEEIIKKEILPDAVAKGQLSQSVRTRLSCCKIIGKLALKFDPFVIKKEILPVVQSLCQDVDYEVRGCMCKQLNLVARGLGLEATKSGILPELVELANDEENYVRCISLETVADILSLLDEKTCSSIITPLVIRFYQQNRFSENEKNLPLISKYIGQFCYKLAAHCDENQKEWFLDCYHRFSLIGVKDVPISESMLFKYEQGTDPILDCRVNAAYNFPAMCLFVGKDNFDEKLQEIFWALCTDPLPAVRSRIATGFHEVVKILGPLSVKLLKNLLDLLRDGSIEVVRGITSHLPEIFEVFGKYKVSEKQIVEIIPALMVADIEVFKTHDWRLQQDFVSHQGYLKLCLNPEVIHNELLPLIYMKLKSARAVPVRIALGKTFLILVRTVKKEEQRERLLAQLTADFRWGNCSRRKLFIEIAAVCLNIYSKSFFKHYFFDDCLSLYCDPVANIRLKLCGFIPHMKRTLNSPEDDTRLDDLHVAINTIYNTDHDREVLLCARLALYEVQQIVVPVHMLAPRTEEKIRTAEELIDQQKLAEERQLLVDEKNEIIAKLKREAQCSKIPSPKKVVVPKTTSEKSSSTPSLKDSKRSLSASSHSLPQVSSPKVKTKVTSQPYHCGLVKSQSTSSICSVSQIPKRDSKLLDSPSKRDTKIPVMGSSPSISKDTKTSSDRSNQNTRIPRVSGPVHTPSPIPASMIPTSPGSQKPGKSGIKPTTPVSSYRKNTALAPAASTTSSSPSTSTQSVPNTSTSQVATRNATVRSQQKKKSNGKAKENQL